jgi:transposase
MDKVWAGIDAGKEVHWAHVLDASGTGLLSRKVENEEADLLRLIDEVFALAGRSRIVWAVDRPGGSAALLSALLWEREQRVHYLPGLAVDRARDAYPGESKTDARDAFVIAYPWARMRSNLAQLVPGEDDLAELQLLLARRRDLVADRTRSINRLRDVLLSLFPALERALDLNAKGALILVRHYQTPSAIRRVGQRRLAAFLKNRGVVKGAEDIARKALTAAKAQSRVALPAENVAATCSSAELAEETLALKESIDTLDGELGRRFFARPEARILASLPVASLGPILGAEFLVSVGDLFTFESADQLAAYAGLVPAAQDSGKRVGNNRRMLRKGNKVLKRVFYQSAFASLRGSPHSRAFYDRKRREGKKHTQALIALARRRVNVLWAMLRDETTFKIPPAA